MTVFIVALATASAGARTISGSASYPERVALPPGAEIVAAVETPDGVLLTEMRRDLGDEQVPFTFSLTAPEDRDLLVRIAIFRGAQPEWLSDAARIEAGPDDVALPPLRLTRFAAIGFATRLRCGDVNAELGFFGQGARLKIDGRTIDLARAAAASGARFAAPDDPGTWAWTKGNRALVSLDGRQLPECRPENAAPLLPLIARGQEPGWSLSMAEGRFRYVGDYGATEIEGPLTRPQAAAEGLRFVLTPRLTATISDRLCRDAARGMPYPMSVSLVHDGAQLSGCAGEPAALLQGQWRVASVQGGAVGAQDAQSIGFSKDGRLWGGGGCNRFVGAYTLTGEGLAFGRLATTMMACAPEAMAAERRFLDALGRVDRFDIGPDGALRLIAADREVITARREVGR